jgi:hypothetical protein
MSVHGHFYFYTATIAQAFDDSKLLASLPSRFLLGSATGVVSTAAADATSKGKKRREERAGLARTYWQRLTPRR